MATSFHLCQKNLVKPVGFSRFSRFSTHQAAGSGLRRFSLVFIQGVADQEVKGA
jgi:hypothetical protein